MLKVGKVYDVEGSPMRYIYRDGYWAMFEECYSLMPRKYVYSDIADLGWELYSFPNPKPEVKLVVLPDVQSQVDN